jgi:OOP family OmpA-OmpF porin
MKTLLILSILLISTSFSFGQIQDILYMKNSELIGYAKSAERYGDIYSAIDYYAEYHRRNKTNLRTSNKLADLYFEIKDYTLAKPLYVDLYQSGDEKYRHSLFNYAMILKVENSFDSALKTLEIYQTQILGQKNIKNRDLILYTINHELEACRNADALTLPQSGITVFPLNNTVNNAYMDFAPVYLNDSLLIYSSLVTDSVPRIKIDDFKNAPVDKFYAALNVNNEWQGGHEAPKPFFNLEGLSVSGGVMSDDHKRFYFTASKMGIDGKQIGSIYVTLFENGEWKYPQKLNQFINLNHYTSCHPTIGNCYDKNLEVIYFVSDRPEGTGGMDIWYTVYDKNNEVYFKPINAGPYINTPGNEISPFFDESEMTMYFSSDGLSGYGGYDIYKTIGELVNWIPPENMGTPLNSVYDDIFYSDYGDDTNGFLVSNRSESKILKSPHCCYDIFSFISTVPDEIEISGSIFEADSSDIYNILKGHKAEDNEVKSSRSIVELHLENKNNGEFILLQTDTTSTDGSFKFKAEADREYMISVTKDNFNIKKIYFNMGQSNDRIVSLDPITIIPIENKPISIDNIYFEFNQWQLNQSAQEHIDSTLLVVMNTYQDIVVEISAHTDGIGDEDYNLVLSKNRSMSVVDYLISKNIDRSRVIAVGYGESHPIENEFDQEGNDRPEARDKNRRIEFRIVGIVVQNKTNFFK